MLSRFVDNLIIVFNPAQSKTLRKELCLNRLIATDDVAALRKYVVTRQDANQKIQRNECPLIYWACCCGSYRVLLYLLAKGTDCNQPDSSNGWRPLDFAIENDRQSLIRILILSGADPNLAVPGTCLLTTRDMAKPHLKQFIQLVEHQKEQFGQLKIQHETQKKLADNAYKLANFKKARHYYHQAVQTCRDIAMQWNSLANIEEVQHLKEYYQAQASHFLKTSDLLSHQAGQQCNNSQSTPNYSM